jgi:hypothetical protein
MVSHKQVRIILKVIKFQLDEKMISMKMGVVKEKMIQRRQSEIVLRSTLKEVNLLSSLYSLEILSFDDLATQLER